MIAPVLALVAAASLLASYLTDDAPFAWLSLGVALVALGLAGWALLTEPPVAEDDSTTEHATVPAEEPGVAPEVEPEREPEIETAVEPEPETEPDPEPAPAAPSSASADELVVVLPGRRRYHRPGCPLVADRDVEELTLEDATEEGFSACSRCR